MIVPVAEGRVDTALHHAHLPVLSDAALLEYDPATGRVVYADNPVLEGSSRSSTGRRNGPETGPTSS